MIQNEAEISFAENDLLKKACEAAEKAQDDLKEKSAVTEVFTWFFFLLHSSLTHCGDLFWEIVFIMKKYSVIQCIIHNT